MPLGIPQTSERDEPSTSITGSMSLRVSVLHADLTDAKHHIVVGHYAGAPMDGAERSVDERLGGKLSKALQGGTYPSDLESFRVFDGTGTNIPGVIAVGLGEPESLSASRLADTLARAFRGFAEERAPGEPPDGDTVPLAVSTVLVGSRSGGSIGVDDSIGAILEAAIRADREIRKDPGLASKVRLGEIEVVELHLDVASDAIRALRRMKRRPPTALHEKEQLHIIEHLRRAPSGLVGGHHPDSFVGATRRLDVATSTTGFKFTLGSEQAAVKPIRKSVNWANIRNTLPSSASADGDYSKAARVLARQVLPKKLIDALPGGADVHLVLDEGAAAVPWELLSVEPRVADELPPIARIGIVRQLETARAQPASREPNRGQAIVIGEPAGVAPPLPGARREAEKISSLFSSREHQVEQMIHKSANEIIEALMLKPYDIVHISAHGTFNADDPLESGVLLGDGRYLTAVEFEDLPQPPTVVFLNCCHLGKLVEGSPRSTLDTKDMGELASSVSKQLIESGVRVVVAAGWPVGDNAAVEFASVLYGELLDGTLLVKAVRTARRATYEFEPEGNTWGAYQVYGNPDFRFDRRDPRDLATAEDLLQVLEAKRLEANKAGTDGSLKEQIGKDLQGLEDELSRRWETGRVFTAFGDGWSAMRNFDRAIEFYEKAIVKSDAPVRAVEQLCNLQTRLAVDRLNEEQPEEGVPPIAYGALTLVVAMKRLQALISAVGETQERLSLLGSGYKCLAEAESGEVREDGLDEARKAYESAVGFSEQDTGARHYYPLTNKVALDILLDGPDGASKTDLDAIEASAADEQAESPNVWARIATADAKGLRAIVDDDDAVEAEAIRAYKAIFGPASGASESNRDSARKLWRFMLEMRSDAPYGDRLRRILAALE